MDDTVPIPGDDPEMNAAIEEARRRLPEFRRALDDDARCVVPEIEGALVKAAVSSIATGKTEHIWVEDAGFEDDMIVGTVSSEPDQIPEVAKGDWITISPDDVSDWVYRHRGRTGVAKGSVLTIDTSTATSFPRIPALCRSFCAGDNVPTVDRRAAEAPLAACRFFPKWCAAAPRAYLDYGGFLRRE
jgi:uncharacterized protein YegJ (DUF2314 family)